MPSLLPTQDLVATDDPWRPSELRQVILLVVVGLVGILLGWWNVNEADSFDDQKGWLIEAILATAFVALVLVRWLAALMRRARQVQRALTAAIAAGVGSG